MDPATPIIITAVATLISALSGVGAANWLSKRSAKLATKRAVLSRLVGNRHELTCRCDEAQRASGESFVALNEALIAYADEKEVLNKLREFQKVWVCGGEIVSELKALIELMAQSAGAPITEIQKDLLMKPFTAPYGDP